MAGDDPQKGMITGDGSGEVQAARSVGSSSTKGVVTFPTRLSDEKLEGALNFQIWRKTILVCLKGMGKAKYLTDLPPESTDPNYLS
ncbi:Amine oxidase [Psidium guajava]|nr:Amine oxidase [Psidium guajava]